MGRVAHLHVLDVASGRVTDLFEGTPYELPRTDPDANCFDISPDGRHIVFTHDPQPQKRIENRKALTELNLRAGKFAALTADAAWDFDAPRYSPDGSRIAMSATHTGKNTRCPGAPRCSSAVAAGIC